MAVTKHDLDSFHHFATENLEHGGAQTMDELLALWQAARERRDVNQIIRQGIEDIDAGRGRPAGEVMEELRQKYQLPAE